MQPFSENTMGRDQKATKAREMITSRLKVSDPRVLMGLSVFFVLLGGMVIDPLAAFTCFVLAGILTFLAVLYGTKRLRYIAFVLLIIVIALAVSKFPEASHHLRVYRKRAHSNPAGQ